MSTQGSLKILLKHEAPKLMITPELTPRLLVTGGAGFIGGHLVNALVKSGFYVTVIDNLETGASNNLHSSVNLIINDIRNEKLLKRLMPSIDGVIHLASIVGMQLAYREAEKSYNISNSGTQLLFETFKVPIVLFSSSAIYGLVNSNTVNENQTVSADDALNYDGGKRGYATGKLALEKIGAAYSKHQPVLIIRPFNVIGPRQVGTYGMVVPSFINNARKNKPLVIYDDGQQRRSFSDVYTFNKYLVHLFSCESAWHAGSNVFNIGNSIDNSIIELAELVIEQTGSNPGMEFIPYNKIFLNKFDVRNRKPDITHLEKQLGPITWPSLRHTVNTILNYNDV